MCFSSFRCRYKGNSLTWMHPQFLFIYNTEHCLFIRLATVRIPFPRPASHNFITRVYVCVCGWNEGAQRKCQSINVSSNNRLTKIRNNNSSGRVWECKTDNTHRQIFSTMWNYQQETTNKPLTQCLFWHHTVHGVVDVSRFCLPFQIKSSQITHTTPHINNSACVNGVAEATANTSKCNANFVNEERMRLHGMNSKMETKLLNIFGGRWEAMKWNECTVCKCASAHLENSHAFLSLLHLAMPCSAPPTSLYPVITDKTHTHPNIDGVCRTSHENAHLQHIIIRINKFQ